MPPSLLATLLADRAHVIPFVGAGMVIEANVPGTAATANALHAEAGRRGVDLPANPADFVQTCAAFEQEFGLNDLRSEVARIVSGSPPTTTPQLEAIARCPSRIILTAN